MVVPLHHHQLVRLEPLPGHVPRLPAHLRQAADADALPLADGVERQADVLANRLALLIDNSSRSLRQVLIQELAERPLADEADAGGVLLRVVGQPRLERDATHLGLPEAADREQHARELLLRQAVQEIALVLRSIASSQQQDLPIGFFYLRIMPGRDSLRAQAHGVVEE